MHNNDIGVEVALKIKGIRVQIWEKTGGLMPHKLLVSGETNADGHFDLSYERTKLNFDGNIKVYIRIVNSNDYVTVSRYALNGIIEPLSFTLGNMTHNYTDGNEVTFNVGNIEAQAGDLAQIFHWASRTMEFVNSEMNGVSGFEMTHLRIFISNEWSHYNMSGSRILLNSMDITSEETVQHEIGHHIHLRILQDGSRQPSGGGTHTSTHNNSHPNQTITEGFADAVAYITDARYFADDQEANILLSGSNNHIQYFRLNIQTHPLTAEEVFARTLLDLFDDVSKFQNYGIPIGIGNWVEWINDIEGGIRNDYANFSYKEIMMPFFQNRSSDETTIQNLGQYFKQLAINTDCNRRQYIKQGMDWNLVNINNLAGFPERLSTDLIFVNQIINHRNDNLSLDNNFNLIEGTPSFYDYTYNSIDRNELNTATGSFNITNNHNGWGTNLSDSLTITDGQTLYVNNNVKSNWLNGSDFNPAQYSHVAMSFCNGATEVENGSSIMIGDWTEYSTATAHIGEGTTLKLLGGVNPSTLIINNNSKLIIEEGGILEFHPNAKIILNGPNAVLEVKGQIRLMPNADFTVEGGAQGFGYIRFYKNMNNNPKLLEGTSNNNIVLTGTGTTHRLIEIDGNEGWQIPPSITNVEISDCKITLGAGSRLNLENENKFTLENVEVDKISLGQARHKGVYIWGWGMYSEINNVTIKGGIQGLYYYPIYKDEQYSDEYLNHRKVLKTHVVKNSHFTDNLTGIKALRVPVWIVDNDFDNYQENAISTSGTLSKDVYIINNRINGTITSESGVNFWGGSPYTTLLFRKNTVSDNKTGLYGFHTRVIPGCNVLSDNNEVAITMEGKADLYMNNLFQSGGCNSLINNGCNILSRYFGRTSINEGMNHFTLGSGIQFALFGNLIPLDPNVYIANNNVFSGTVDPYLGPANHTWADVVNSGKNGYFSHKFAPEGLRGFSNINSISPSAILSSINSECAGTEWETIPELTEGMPPTPLVQAIDVADFGNINGALFLINTNDYQNVPVKDVLADLYVRARELDGESPSDIISSYTEIFTVAYTPVDSTREIFYELYSQLLGSLTYWTNTGVVNTRVNDTLAEDLVFAQVSDLLDDILIQSSEDSMHFLFNNGFNIQVDKIELMRLASNYTMALNEIENVITEVMADSAKSFILTKLECITHAEQDLFEGRVSPDSLFDLYSCLDAHYPQLSLGSEDSVGQAYISGVVYDAFTLLPLDSVIISFTSATGNFSTVSLSDGSFSTEVEINGELPFTISINHPGYLPYSDTDTIYTEQTLTKVIYLTPEEGLESKVDNTKMQNPKIPEYNKTSVLIYPNPASNELFVKQIPENTNSAFEIYNLLGKKVLNGSLNGEENSIDIRALNTGIYVIRVKTFSQTFSYKFAVIKE